MALNRASAGRIDVGSAMDAARTPALPAREHWLHGDWFVQQHAQQLARTTAIVLTLKACRYQANGWFNFAPINLRKGPFRRITLTANSLRRRRS